MGSSVLLLGLVLVAFVGAASSAPASSPNSKILNGYFSDLASVFVKWMWSLKATTKTAVSGRPMVKFESGFTVATVFDGSKLGIEPHTVEVLPNGELLIWTLLIATFIESRHRCLYIAYRSWSQDPLKAMLDILTARLERLECTTQRGLQLMTGETYILHTVNMAIRKISETGITTIAGGKLGRGGSHVDEPSEDAKFSNDFDVVYIGSSCSLLVIDRGN